MKKPAIRAPTHGLSHTSHSKSHCAYKRGKEQQMTTFQIQNNDGMLSSVSHKDFFEILNGKNTYLYYKQGGTHLAMLPTAENEETIRICRQADNAENYAFATASRCLDEKGHLCRYQHDANGKVIRDETGKPVSAKCGNCPRDGWIAGERENCCIRNYCKVTDCAHCPHDREYRVPLSLERFADENYDSNEYSDRIYTAADPNADIQAALESDELSSALHIAITRLTPNEQTVIKAIYWKGVSQRTYATDSGMSRSAVKRLYDRALESLKNILKDFH